MRNPPKRLIDVSDRERTDRIHAICAVASSDEERALLYWQFCIAEMNELNALGGPQIQIPERP